MDSSYAFWGLIGALVLAALGYFPAAGKVIRWIKKKILQ